MTIEAIKQVAELVKLAGRIDLYEQILDLREEMVTLRSDKLKLSEELAECKRVQDISDRLVKRGNFYYKRLDDGKEDGPLCVTCWDAENKAIHVLEKVTTDYMGRKTNVLVCDWCARNRIQK